MDRSLVTLVRNASDLLELTKAHELVVSSGHSGDRFLANLLVQSYGRCGSVRDARAVFDGIRARNSFSWAIMLAAYVHNGHDAEALDLFARMSREGAQPDEFAFASVLGACGSVKQGKAIHAQIESSGLEPDVVLGTALVNMYAKCWAVEEAKRVFDQMAERNVVTWTAMITAFAQEGLLDEALRVLKGMDCEGLKQNEVTFISLLGACSSPQDVDRGREVYARAVACGYQTHTAVQNAAVNMFVKCGSVASARNIFETMEKKDLVSWNEMIAALALKGPDDGEDAVRLFWRMNLEGFRPNDFTFSSILGSCSAEQGSVIHQCIASSAFTSDTTVQNALLHMYAKAGRIQRAKDLFDGIGKKTLVSWTTMITAYSQHGGHEEALEIFKAMILEGFEPDDVTFISILNACSHAGLLYQGWFYYTCMSEDYELPVSQEHHACMIDLLVKAGWMSQAEEFVRRLPGQSDPVLWRILLNACSMHGEVARAARVTEIMSKLEPNDDSHFVLLSNVYKTSFSRAICREDKSVVKV